MTMPNLPVAAVALVDMARIIGVTEKSIASVARKFRATLRSLAVSSMTSGTSILADVRRTVRKGIEDAYVEGLIEAGLTPADITDEEFGVVEELVFAQLDFVPDFVKAITQSRKDRALQREILDTRIPFWAASIEHAGQVALANAAKNEVVEFGLDPKAEPSEESCPTCIGLMGKRMRRKTVAAKGLLIHPGNENYVCGGWRCPHAWNPTK